MRCILCYDSRREVKAKMKIDFDWLIMMPLSFLYIGIVFYYVKYKKRKVPYIIVFTLFFTYMAEVLKYTQFPICLNMDMEELNRQCVNYIPFHFLYILNLTIFCFYDKIILLYWNMFSNIILYILSMPFLQVILCCM